MASPNSVSLKSWLKLFFFQMCKLHTTPLIHGQHLHRSAGADRGLVSPTAGVLMVSVFGSYQSLRLEISDSS